MPEKPPTPGDSSPEKQQTNVSEGEKRLFSELLDISEESNHLINRLGEYEISHPDPDLDRMLDELEAIKNKWLTLVLSSANVDRHRWLGFVNERLG